MFYCFWNDNIVYVKPSKFLELSVLECEDVNSTSVVSKNSKNAILETGVNIKVPLFVKVNDIVKVDTEEKSYISRIN